MTLPIPPAVFPQPPKRFRNEEFTLTQTERRTLLRLVDDKWEDINRMRPRDGSYLDQSDVLYLQTLEQIQQKLKT